MGYKVCADDDGEYFCRVVLACERIKFVRSILVCKYSEYLAAGKIFIYRKQARLIQIDVSPYSILRSLEDSREPGRPVSSIPEMADLFLPEHADIVARANCLATS
jgi:hypothetical protein